MVVEWLCKRREGGNTQKLVNAVNEIHKKKEKTIVWIHLKHRGDCVRNAKV